jgi:hypothetical protein
MENFIYSDNFYSDISELENQVLYDEEIDNVSELPNDWEIDCEYTEERLIGQFDKEELINDIWDMYESAWADMMPDDCDKTLSDLKKAISAGIDVEKMNPLVPIVHYPTGEKFKITKKDLLENS